MVAVWMVGRRAALAAEIAVYKNDPRWLKYGVSIAVLLPVHLTSAMIALMGIRKQPHYEYKGPSELKFQELKTNKIN